MGFIYLIENDLNDKKYVGLTTRSVERRWKEHLRQTNQLIDEIIAELGEEHFRIKVIEDCPDEIIDDREKYWINYYDSFNNGYNMTCGGRAETMVLNTDKMQKTIELWNQGYGQKAITQELSLNVETVHNYLLKNGITSEMIKERHKELVGKSKSKQVFQYDLQGKLINIWNSIIDIERKGVASRSSVGRCLNGKQKSACGYIWSYVPLEDFTIEKIKIEQYDLEGNLIAVYDNASLAARTISEQAVSSHILEVCKNQRKTAYGFKWKKI